MTLRGARPTSVIAIVVATLVAGLLVVAATTSTGFPTTSAKTRAQSVWVTNGRLGMVGRLNQQTDELETGVILGADEPPELFQDGETVIVHDKQNHRLQWVDTSIVRFLGELTVPPDADVAVGGPAGHQVVAVLDPDSGSLWIRPVAELTDGDLTVEQPTAEVGRNAHPAVAADGTVYAAGPGSETVAVVRPQDSGDGGAPTVTEQPVPGGALSDRTGSLKSDPVSVATIGDQFVVLDAAARRVVVGDRSFPVDQDAGNRLVLQQSGPAAPKVLLATDSRLLQLDLLTGALAAQPALTRATPSRPVRVGGCAHGAWAGDEPTYLRVCDGKAPSARAIPRATAEGTLVFRVNRDVVSLNDSGAGTSWTLDTLTVVDNWEVIEQPDDIPTGEGTSVGSSSSSDLAGKRAVCTDEIAAPKPKNDRVALRAGHPTVIPVVANDAISGCAVPVITRVDAAPETGTVQVVDNGKALQVTPAAGASGALPPVSYTVSTGPRLQAGGILDLTVLEAAVPAKPPRARRSPSVDLAVGGRTTYNVLTDFYSPTGDALSLVGARAAEGSGLTVGYTPDGWLELELSESAGSKPTVQLQVSDGTNVVPATLTVAAIPRADATPSAPGLRVTAEAGRPQTFDALARASTPKGGKPRLVDVQAVSPDVQVAADPASGSVTVTGPRPGIEYLRYTVTAGGQQTEGRIRVDVTAPDRTAGPVAEADQVHLVPGTPVSIDPTANDIAAGDAPLAVAAVALGPDAEAAGLRAVVIDGATVRISSRTAVPAGGVWLSYTVTDGSTDIDGAIEVLGVDADPTPSAPTARDLKRKVRTGDVITVPIEAFAADAQGSALQIDPIESDYRGREIPGRLSVSGRGISYQAPDSAGQLKVQYTVRNREGRSRSAMLTLQIVAGSKTNRPPAEPTPAVGRVFTDRSTEIILPFDALDPDGDSVYVSEVDGGDLGRVAISGTNSLMYTAGGQGGVDEFGYTATDARGETVSGRVRVVVMEPGLKVQPPVAPELSVVVAPGAVTELRVLGEVIDPAGLPVAFAEDPEVVGRPGVASAKLRGDGAIEISAADAEGRTRLRYTVANSRQAKASGTIEVTVDPDAPQPQPRAADIFVTADMVADATSTAAVDVSRSVTNVGGLARDLQLLVPELHRDRLTVSDGRTLGVRVTEHRQVFSYLVRDGDDGLTAEAFLIVPSRAELQLAESVSADRSGGDDNNDDDGADRAAGQSSQPPTESSADPADPSAAGTSGTTGADVSADPGSSESPTSAEDRASTPEPSGRQRDTAGQAGAGTPTTRAPTTRAPTTGAPTTRATTAPRTSERSASSEDSGPPAGSSGTDGPAESTEAAAPTPPTVRRFDLPVEPGKPESFDLSGLVDTADPAQRGRLQYSLADEQPPQDMTVSLDGSTATVSVPLGVAPGEIGGFDFVVTDPELGDGQTGNVVVTAVAVDAETADVPDVEKTVNKDEATRIELLEDSFNPLGEPLSVVELNGDGLPGTVTADGDGAAVVTATEMGSFAVPFTVADGSGDETRNVPAMLRITVRGKPSRPGKPELVGRDNGSVTVQWAASQENGSPIEQYRVTAEPGGQTTTCPKTTCTVDGLTNGTGYTFTVVATNASGDSVASAPSKQIVPDAVPAAPELTLTRGDGKVTARWTKPATDGTPIAGYTLAIEPAPDKGPDRIPVAGGDAGEHDFTDLSNGRRYTITVLAKNGSGTASDPVSDVVIPAGKPGRPGKPTITAGRDAGQDSQVEIRWKPADGHGIEAITYLVRWTADGKKLSTDTIEPGQPLVSRIGDVTLGVTYAATITARTDVTDSEPTPEISVTPTVFPETVRDLTATATGEPGRARLAWAQPPDSGMTIDRFEASINGESWVDVGTELQADVEAPNGQQNTFRVRQCTAGGECSEPSKAASATPYGPAGPVTALTADVDSRPTEIAATWSPPGNDGGLPVAGYQVRLDDADWIDTTDPGHTFTGLSNGQQHRISVRSVSKAPGDSRFGEPATVSATPYGRPEPPQLTSATAGLNQIRLTWTAPADTGGVAVNGFQARRDGGAWTDLGVGGGGRSAVVDDASHARHTWEVRAKTGAGQRNRSDASNGMPATSYGEIDKPTVTLKVSKDQVTVNWKTTTEGKGREISGREVTVRFGGKQQFSSTKVSGSKTLTPGWDTTVNAKVEVCVAGGGCKSDTAKKTTGKKPAPPGTVKLVHGPDSGKCSSSCWYLAFRYENLPRATYRVCFIFTTSSAGSGCWRPEERDTYNSTLKGSGKWVVTGVPDASARYGYPGDARVVITNVDTGQKYKSPWVEWLDAGG